MMLATISFCGGGILEKHPRLRVAFLEGNAGWLPWLLGRLDDHYELRFGVTPEVLPQKPSYYFSRQCYLSAECDEEIVGEVIRRFGAGNFVTSTDFPHPDSKYPRAVETFLAKEDISFESKKRILWDNCVKLYGLERQLGLQYDVAPQNGASDTQALASSPTAAGRTPVPLSVP
jgi:predicted TIM-barrel fold metal-dependent hydrolase